MPCGDAGWDAGWTREGHPLLFGEPASNGSDYMRVSKAIDSSSGHPLLAAETDDDRRTTPPPSSVASLSLTGNDVTKSSNGADDGDGEEDCLIGHYLVADTTFLLPPQRRHCCAREQFPSFVPDDPNQFEFSFLDDQDDCISVLTSKTFFTTASEAASCESDYSDYSEFCDVSDGDSLHQDYDLMSDMTPRTANYSSHAPKISRSVSADVSAYNGGDNLRDLDYAEIISRSLSSTSRRTSPRTDPLFSTVHSIQGAT